MKITLLSLMVLIPCMLLGTPKQKKRPGYYPGAIISLNNDTVDAQIKFDGILKLQSEVKFIDAGGRRKSFKPGVISGFYFIKNNDTLYFESRDDIRISIFPSRKGNFVLRLSNDIYPLYYFVTSRMKNTGIESEMLEVPHFLVHMDYRWYHYNADNFEDCVRLFRDDIGLVRDINSDKYTFTDFPEIVDRYCKSIKGRNQ